MNRKEVESNSEGTVITYDTEELSSALDEGPEEENSQVDEEPETESLESKIATTCEVVRAMDFTVNEPHMNVTPEENQKYLEAYLKVLKNEMPVYNRIGKKIYYRDLWRAGIEFEDLLENNEEKEFPYLYYYDDLDGDGKPEFAVNQGCLYIFNYELEGDFVVSFTISKAVILERL